MSGPLSSISSIRYERVGRLATTCLIPVKLGSPARDAEPSPGIDAAESSNTDCGIFLVSDVEGDPRSLLTAALMKGEMTAFPGRQLALTNPTPEFTLRTEPVKEEGP
jgi:hypothetical protein